MKYLIVKDLYPYLKSDNLLQITENNNDLLDDVEAACILKIQQYTSRWFESDCLFPIILPYDSNTSYVVGDYVIEDDLIYVAETDIPSPSNIQMFKLKDPRNSLIKQWLIDLVIFDIHSRISPHQIPPLRFNRKEDVMSALKDMANGLYRGLDEECLRKDDGGNISSFSWGSEKKIRQYW